MVCLICFRHQINTSTCRGLLCRTRSCARRFCASRFCVRRHNRGLVRFVTRLAMAGRHWQQWVPIVPAMKGYQREDFGQDLIAGVVVGMVTVPQAVAYAYLAGLPPQAGLYACLLPMLIYGVLGQFKTSGSRPCRRCRSAGCLGYCRACAKLQRCLSDDFERFVSAGWSDFVRTSNLQHGRVGESVEPSCDHWLR